jgi:hypothetical protein
MKDVTTELRRLVLNQGGWRLEIGVDEDLDKIFGRSYNPRRKRLTILYTLRGIVGVHRVDEVHGRIRSHVRLGYPPPPRVPPIKALNKEEAAQVEEANWRGRLSAMRAFELQNLQKDPNFRRMAMHRHNKAKSDHEEAPVPTHRRRNIIRSTMVKNAAEDELPVIADVAEEADGRYMFFNSHSTDDDSVLTMEAGEAPVKGKTGDV